MKKIIALLLSVTLVMSLLSACAKTNDPGEKTPEPTKAAENNSPTEPAEDAEPTQPPANVSEEAAQAGDLFPSAVNNTDPSINGGTLKVALVASSAFAGVLNVVSYEDNFDAQLLGWFSENILSADDNFVFDQDGAATYEYDVAAKTVTLHMKDGVKWHDGEPVTLDDLVYSYEVIAHKDYKGLRYDSEVTNVVGVEEYHDGKADKISGLELSEDKMTLTIRFKEFDPSVLVGGFWIGAIPRHYYQDVPVKEMASHEKSRSKPIGFGPFKVKNVVPGEAVEFERFDDYYLGAPKLDSVIVTVVNPELVPAAMQEGQFDVAEFSTQQYPDYQDPTNYVYLGQLQTVFNYTGFKLGKWDAEKNTNVVNPDSKMWNVKLRQAIGYAVDNATICSTLYNGLRFLATTVITPRHGTYQNKELEGYVYDPEKAKQLLDEAGYVDVDGDGFREDPQGNPFTITWAMMDGQGADVIAQFKIQNWADVGLKVELYNGRLTEFNAFYDAVEMDDPAIDMYDAAWQTGFNPNPDGLWGHSSSANYTRYTSDTFDAIIADISSEKAWDSDFLSQRYHDWQQTFFDEAPAIPTQWRVVLTAVNHRVKNYELTSSDIKLTAHLIELTAEETVK